MQLLEDVLYQNKEEKQDGKDMRLGNNESNPGKRQVKPRMAAKETPRMTGVQQALRVVKPRRRKIKVFRRDVSNFFKWK